MDSRNSFKDKTDNFAIGYQAYGEGDAKVT